MEQLSGLIGGIAQEVLRPALKCTVRGLKRQFEMEWYRSILVHPMAMVACE